MNEREKPVIRDDKAGIEAATSLKDTIPVIPAPIIKPGPAIVETPPLIPVRIPWWKRCFNYVYNRKENLYCERSFTSWMYMILYSILYIIFVSTYTLVFMFASLMIIRSTEIYTRLDKSVLMSFQYNGLGLTATPTTLDSVPLISYTNGHSEQFSKYIKSLDDLLVKRRKRQVRNITDLGPCGVAPYGYGSEPCIIIRPNKQLRWSAQPLKLNSTSHLPKDLQNWLKLKEQKLWLHCSGYHSYDKEHIGNIKYYPYPPGFDSSIFPLTTQNDAPLIAIQISNFTLGLSLAVECKMWYDTGVSSVAFLLYVEPKSRSVSNKKV